MPGQRITPHLLFPCLKQSQWKLVSKFSSITLNQSFSRKCVVLGVIVGAKEQTHLLVCGDQGTPLCEASANPVAYTLKSRFHFWLLTPSSFLVPSGFRYQLFPMLPSLSDAHVLCHGAQWRGQVSSSTASLGQLVEKKSHCPAFF